jgi:hypothetical protein
METRQSTDSQNQISREFINIEKVFDEKNPKFSKLIPGFVFSYLKRVIHQDELNKALYEFRDKFGVEFLDGILDKFGVKVETVGLENLPAEGRQIIVANHPLGGLDGMALMREIAKVRQDFLFPVNDLLMHLPNLKRAVHSHQQTRQQRRQHQAFQPNVCLRQAVALFSGRAGFAKAERKNSGSGVEKDFSFQSNSISKRYHASAYQRTEHRFLLQPRPLARKAWHKSQH